MNAGLEATQRLMSLTTSSTENEPLLRRLRRMGLVLTGDQQLADGILRDAFMRAQNAVSASQELSEKDIFKLGFDAFDDAVHRKGVVVILNRAGSRDGSLGDRVNRLSYVERVAIALLVVENMTPKEGAVLSGLPGPLLENALTDAMTKLEQREAG